MAEIVHFALPLPPSVNNQYATVNGRRVLSRPAQRWKTQARQVLDRLVLPDAFSAALQEGYLALFIDFYFETPLRRDLDGGLKIAQDVICQSLGIDDRRVVDIHLVKRIDPLHPRIEVELEALQTWDFDEERQVL
ncbi:MAG TPA: RusA family crossover junction endodeoxyribonuclease [Herpetosiphonaceae bacterium]